jgi:hypothetical protein
MKIKMKKKAFIIIFVILIAGFIIYKSFTIYQRLKTPFQNQTVKVDSITNNRLKIAAKESTGIKIDTSIIMKTGNNNNIKLSKILEHPPKLIFVFEDKSCEKCIDIELETLNNFTSVIGEKNIIYISSFENTKKHLKFEKKKGIKIYNIAENHLGLPVENSEYPFLFLVDTNYLSQAVSPSAGLALNIRPLYLSISLHQYFTKRVSLK